MTYESPFVLIVEKMATEIAEKFDGEVMTAIRRYHVDVDKDELVKALAYDRGQYEKGYADGYADGLAADRWVSVEDRLPDTHKRALVAADFSGIADVDVAIYCGDGMWESMSGLYPKFSITHWMPLPEPPEVTEDA